MTSQITIKLNEERFKPLLDELMKITFIDTYSECAAKCIFLAHKLAFKRIPELENMTQLEYLIRKKGMSFEEGLLQGMKEYSNFSKGVTKTENPVKEQENNTN